MGNALSNFGGPVSQSDFVDSVSQLRLPFPNAVSGFDDLAITDANRAAIEAVKNWQNWQSPRLCLIGPVQCGLGIIGTLWAAEAKADFVTAADFDSFDVRQIEALSEKNCVLDLADDVTNESHLLTLLNLGQAKGALMLLTARTAGKHWACQSADLKSRLSTMPVAEIYPPDEAMIEARLRVSAKRRFIKLGDATINFLAIRLPRSYLAIEDYMTRLDQAVSDTGRAPNIKLAKDVLEEGVSSRQLFTDRPG